MKRIDLWAMCVVMLLVACPVWSRPAAVVYQIRDLGAWEASAINDSDQIVRSYGYGCPPSSLPCDGGYPDHAFVGQGTQWWDPGTLGGTTSCALSINNAGQIVGYGTHDGKQAAFLLTPIPEPSTILALLCGVGGLAFWRRRR